MQAEVKKAAQHPDVQRPTNEELINLAQEVVNAIELCGASVELTNAVSKASDLVTYLRKPIKNDTVEYGWLVEKGAVNYPVYASVRDKVLGWAISHEEAIRFARKEDAEMFASCMQGNEYPIRVACHGWDMSH